VPRWWRDFEITYRRGRTIYRIKIENPLAVSHGVATVELEGVRQVDYEIPLSDDGQTHNVRVVLGERAKADLDESESGREEPAGNQAVKETQR